MVVYKLHRHLYLLSLLLFIRRDTLQGSIETNLLCFLSEVSFDFDLDASKQSEKTANTFSPTAAVFHNAVIIKA